MVQELPDGAASSNLQFRYFEPYNPNRMMTTDHARGRSTPTKPKPCCFIRRFLVGVQLTEPVLNYR